MLLIYSYLSLFVLNCGDLLLFVANLALKNRSKKHHFSWFYDILTYQDSLLS